MSNTELSKPWLRGVLEPCLLGLLTSGEAYGYDLSVRLETVGLGRVPGGSLYPALARLEKHGLVEPEWRPGDGGPGRKYYRITPAGRASLAEQTAAWRAFTSSVEDVLHAAEISDSGKR